MAIKPCKECHHSISDKAESCPNCGAKTNKVVPRWIVWLIFLGIFGVIANTCSTEYSSYSTTKNSEQQNTIVSEKKSYWNTNISEDSMRGTKTIFTSNTSNNSVNFDFPYNGGSKLSLTVQNNSRQKDIYITILKGQFLCSLSEDCKVNFKFDNGSIQAISMVGSSSQESNVLFVENSKTIRSLIEKMKKSRSLIIEPMFYQEGSRQFYFNLEGFKTP